MAGFEMMFAHNFQINTTPEGETETLAPLAVGISNVEPANNEELDQTIYLDGDGYGTTDVIGAQMTLAFTGHRYYGDAAQDFIFGTQLELGNGRKTTFEWLEPGGGTFTGNITIANISGPSGDAGAKGEVSFEIHFNGKPTYTPPTP
ncbi:phage tail tube protein [Paraliobacillus ryukyuensis]|uniref:phage tail tube protein n=1 Tax=Paraliobacillus ryukyuensis TaxID=200904 RepID=UPI0009A72F34|nr:capsid protein [Paraliobacillus ryukyuensis]